MPRFDNGDVNEIIHYVYRPIYCNVSARVDKTQIQRNICPTCGESWAIKSSVVAFIDFS